MDFGRLLTAMVTPMNKAGEVDYQRAASLANKLLQEGNDGLVVTGTTGESPTLTHKEKLTLWERVVDAVGDRAPVLAGTGTNDTAATVEMSREAERIGVHGILLVTPYYNKPSQEGLFQHMQRAADAVRLPVMIYNVPGRTSVDMKAATILRLAEAQENVVAVKEASGDLDQVGDLLRGRAKGFKVYSGDDKFTLPFMSVGADGVVSVAGHLVGSRMKDMMDAFEAGHLKKAQGLHLALLPLFRDLLSLAPNPVPVKTALRLAGFDVGLPRLPLVPLSASEEETLLEVLRGAEVV